MQQPFKTGGANILILSKQGQSEGLQDGRPVPGQEVDDQLVHVLVATRYLFPKNSMNFILLSAIRSSAMKMNVVML